MSPRSQFLRTTDEQGEFTTEPQRTQRGTETSFSGTLTQFRISLRPSLCSLWLCGEYEHPLQRADGDSQSVSAYHVIIPTFTTATVTATANRSQLHT